MIINPYKYPFIVIEGMDGCGKDTAVESLRKHFGEKAIFTMEPTNSTYGQEVRQVLNNKGRDIYGKQLQPEDIQRLFTRDRLSHRFDESQWLRSRPVFSNRDWESTCAYYAAYGGDIADIVRLHEEEFNAAGGEFFVSDLTVIVDITPEEAVRRQIAQGKQFDHFEDDMKKREKIRRAYLDLPKTLAELVPAVPFNIRVIDGMQSKGEVFADVLALARETFTRKIEGKF